VYLIEDIIIVRFNFRTRISITLLKYVANSIITGGKHLVYCIRLQTS
jgi:hypothetical protein